MANATAKKKRVRKEIGFGVAHIQSTFNNTIITITDHEGNTICSTSSGTAGFKGARKGTPFAAQLAGKEASTKARDMGVKYVDVRISGPGAGRESAIRALQSSGLEIKSIRDVTPIPHNGCRVPRRRRV
ncbi:MAG: 30S ribosomal protein S11 [Candidatus Aminicenantes bacterium RBG_19FT_COMBO_59_29]|jgi:small subunit ribosomal protein S11|nr:MAG: 30S ribosomal protein S11 [Candidatus Aminicenantes bacterium RBG_19FT_COMBO_59_29]